MDDYKLGIHGLDFALGKGIPDRMVIILNGIPGTGTEVFAQQFLYYGLLAGETGFYFTSEKSAETILADMEFFKWDFKEYSELKLDLTSKIPTPHEFMKQGKLHFIDSYSMKQERKYVEELPNLRGISWDMGSLNHLSFFLKKYIRETNGKKRAIIDSLSHLLRNEETDVVVELFEDIQLNARKYGGIYIFLLVEGMHEPTVVNTFMHIADGVIDFTTHQRGSELENVLRVRKLRNMIYSTKMIPYVIQQKGMVIETTERIL
jgi:KaiC/GvpD/RAD55 family RecA-like ATPase